MARILVLTPQLPYPPQQGTSLRNYHLLRALAQHHTVTLLSFIESGQSQELNPLRSVSHVLPPVNVPERSGVDRLRQLATSQEPDMALRLRDEDYATTLTNALRSESYDIIQVEGIELARYMHTIRAAAPGVRIILDCHNAETELQRRSLKNDLLIPMRWPAAAYSAMQIGRLARFERWAINTADAAIAVSETDRDHLLELESTGDKPIYIIPNTIDVSEYAIDSIRTPVTLDFDLVFTGKMDYRPNIDGVLWFANEIWPEIRRVRPQTTWAIVGQRPHPRLDSLRGLEGVTLTGRVPEIQPYLKGGRVYIVPLRIGSGTRLKLIEAMAAGKAIVSTSIGAEGFPVVNGEHILLADDPAAWAQAICSLLDDESKRAQLGVAAQAFAAQYDWRRIVPRLDALVAEVVKVQ